MLSEQYYFLNEIINDSPDVNLVTWTLSSVCSYNCWYCVPNLHDGKNKFKDPDKCLEFFRAYCKNKKVVVLSLLGGEPTLWNKLSYFLENLPSNVYVEMNSNTHRTLRWWKQNLQRVDAYRLTYHPNDVDDDNFYEILEYLESTNKYIDVTIIYDNTNQILKHKSENFFNRLKQSNLKIDAGLSLLRKNAGAVFFNYTDEEMTVYKQCQFSRSIVKSIKPSMFKFEDQYEGIHQLKLTNENKFKGWSCSAGVNGIYIDEKGDIFRATCYVGGKIGNIETDYSFIENNIGYIKCNKEYCGCGDDIVLHKKK